MRPGADSAKRRLFRAAGLLSAGLLLVGAAGGL
jgi:hypothetical protein